MVHGLGKKKKKHYYQTPFSMSANCITLLIMKITYLHSRSLETISLNSSDTDISTLEASNT